MMPSTIQFDVSLQPYNSMSIPATATALTTANTVEDIVAAIEYAHSENLPVLVLGEGSNTIFAADYPGLVVLNRLHGIETLQRGADLVHIRVGAGENWHDLVEYSVQQGWYGLENLALIPGLVGAAPIQNIGAYGVEVKDVLTQVECLELRTGQKITLSAADCGFGYRDSRFKRDLAGKVVITAVDFALSLQPSVEIAYPALANKFSCEPTPEQVFRAVCDIRRSKLPMPSDIPNTGSFFKNPIVAADKHHQLKQQYPDLVSYPVGDDYKLAAGWLIERAGWKGRELAGIRVHPQQALVITNANNQSGDKILQFAHNIQADIGVSFGISLEIEPTIIG